MDLFTLNDVVGEWSLWGKEIPKSIPRSPYGLPKSLPTDLVTAIQGVRRCGKSTFMYQMVERFGLDHSRCFFINFEDPRLSSSLNPGLLDAIYQLAIDTKGPDCVFFLDEIQNVSEWEKWLRSKLSLSPRSRFIITGSNASLLSGDLGTVLTGRHITLEMFPFSFEEFQLATGKTAIEEYLKLGGFPRALSFENATQLLREYFKDIIEKDVRRHVAVRSATILQNLVKTVFESTGSEVSQRSLASTLGTTADSIGTYLEACEAAYILQACPYFSYSERQRQVRNKKFYPIDTGLKNAVVTKTGKDLGKDFETIVYRKLRERFHNVSYWKGKCEVDFVVQTTSGILPVQVSIDGAKQRHTEGVVEFTQGHKNVLPGLHITFENFHTLEKLLPAT
jgi:predicted AAA+ superfamily ATPase